MSVSASEKKHYKSIGHNLKPVVIIAQKGFSDAVKAEVNRALTEHELIKIKLLTENRNDKKALIQLICEQMNAQLIQSIGHMALFYRAAKKPDPKLSNLLRN